MKFKMNYGRLNRSEFVEKAVAEELEHAVNKMKDSELAQVTVWLDSENSPNSAGLPEYKCTLNLRAGKDDIFVQKKHRSLLKCLHNSREALEKQLRRKHKKYLSRRSRDEVRQFDVS